MKRVFLTGKDNVNWALDTDYEIVKKAINGSVNIINSVEKADIIHSMIWYDLLNINKKILKNKIVITAVPHDIRHMLSMPEYLLIAPYVNLWVAISNRSKKYLDVLGLPNIYIPYGYNDSIYFKMNDESSINDIIKKYKIPLGKYLIGSFQRDTEGADLVTPKYIKGPDIFLEIVKNVYKENKNINVILAGPRRYWLRDKFNKYGIPFTYVGKIINYKDDIVENTLSSFEINRLYNLIDLYIVSSRMEGGPKAVLECAATQTKVISTDVGLVSDVLHEKQIYKTIIEGAAKVLEDIKTGYLEQYFNMNSKKINNHKLENISKKLNTIYDDKNLKKIKKDKKRLLIKELRPLKKGLFGNMSKNDAQNKCITIHYKFHKPPWGGANQFLLALSKKISEKGWTVHKSLTTKTQKILFNSFLIDFDKMNKIKKNTKFLINRIDGPTVLVRSKDKEIDDNIFKLNRDKANVSVFQSEWSLFESLKMGYKPVNPILITNAVNAHIFNNNNRISFNNNRKIKIISSCWSPNPMKGEVIYKWLDENLDWEKYEYTFVGRVTKDLKNINIIEPVASEELSELLKKHDVFITASKNDPCSNALLEALACGLPVIYKINGGHPELVAYGGLGFDDKKEIPRLLNMIMDNYQTFQKLIRIHDMDYISDKYIKCIGLINWI